MKKKYLASLFIGSGALLAVAAIAGPPILQNLNPPPADYYTCKATGSGAICRGQVVETVNQEPSGIICGTAQNPVELLQSFTNTLALTRYYDTAGDLTRRFRKERSEGVMINPVTGLSANYTWVLEYIDTLAVPGNFETVTTQQGGQVKIALPGSGVLTMDAGRVIYDAEGDILSSVGRHDLDDYFLNGNHEAMAQLCAALGSPGTP